MSMAFVQHQMCSQAFLAVTESFIAARIHLREEVVDVTTSVLSSGLYRCIDIHDINVLEKAVVANGFLLHSYQR